MKKLLNIILLLNIMFCINGQDWDGEYVNASEEITIRDTTMKEFVEHHSSGDATTAESGVTKTGTVFTLGGLLNQTTYLYGGLNYFFIGTSSSKMAGVGVNASLFTVNSDNDITLTSDGSSCVWNGSYLICDGDTVADYASTVTLIEEYLPKTPFNFDYTFSSLTTDSRPGAGYFKLNSSTISSVTQIYVDYIDANSVTKSDFISNVDTGSFIAIYSGDDYALYKNSGGVTDASNYFKFNVTYLAGSGTITGSSEIVIDNSGGGGSGVSSWGEILGTLSDQTDLQDALNTKIDTGTIDSSWVNATIGTLDVDSSKTRVALFDSIAFVGSDGYLKGFDDSDTLDIGTVITPKIKAEGEPLYFEDSENTTPLSLSELKNSGTDNTLVSSTDTLTLTDRTLDGNGISAEFDKTDSDTVKVSRIESIAILNIVTDNAINVTPNGDFNLNSDGGVILDANGVLTLSSEGSGSITTDDELTLKSGIYSTVIENDTTFANGEEGSTANTYKAKNFIGETLEVEKTITDTVVVGGDTITATGNAQPIIESIEFNKLNSDTLILGTDTITSGSKEMSMYLHDGSVTLTATQDVFAKITGLTEGYNQDDYFTVAGDSVQLVAGDYAIEYSVSFSGSSTDVWEGAIFDDNVEIVTGGGFERGMSGSDSGVINTFWKGTISSTSWISFRMQNTVNSNDPTISFVNISIRKIN